MATAAKNPLSKKVTPCAKSEGGKGCIVKRGGEWVILNNKKAGNPVWKKCGKGEEGRKKCVSILGAYHSNK